MDLRDCTFNYSNTEAPITGEIVKLSCAPIVISNIISWLFIAAGVVALFLIIIGGFKFLTSGGDKEKVEGARKTLTWAIIGLIVIFLSYAIVRLVGDITGITCLKNLGSCPLTL